MNFIGWICDDTWICFNHFFLYFYLQICGVTDRKYTYLQLYKQSQIFGANLRKKFKVRDRDVVCIMLPNSPEYPIVLLGILTAGGSVTTVNPTYTVCRYFILCLYRDEKWHEALKIMTYCCNTFTSLNSNVFLYLRLIQSCMMKTKMRSGLECAFLENAYLLFCSCSQGIQIVFTWLRARRLEGRPISQWFRNVKEKGFVRVSNKLVFSANQIQQRFCFHISVDATNLGVFPF